VGGVGAAGRDGPGPDLVRIPDEVAPGRWQICETFDEPDRLCVELEVVEPA